MDDRGLRVAVWTTVLLVLGLVALYLSKAIDGDLLQTIATVFGGLLAAYFGARVGASAAVDYQERKDAKAKISSAVENANELIFALKRRGLVAKSILESAEADLGGGGQHLGLRPLVLPSLDIPLPLGKQTTLLHSGGGPLLLEISQLDMEYGTTIEWIRKRNEIYEGMQRTLEEKGVPLGVTISEKDFVSLGIEVQAFVLKDVTDTMLRSLGELVDWHQSAEKKIQRFVSETYLKIRADDYVDPPGGR